MHILISFARFRNCLLYKAGLYRVAVTIIRGNDKQPSSFEPVVIHAASLPMHECRARTYAASLDEPPTTTTDSHMFLSSAFEVRFDNEEIILHGEHAMFVEIENTSQHSIVIILALQFCETTTDLTPQMDRHKKTDSFSTLDTTQVVLTNELLRECILVTFSNPAQYGSAILEVFVHSSFLPSRANEDANNTIQGHPGLLVFGNDWESRTSQLLTEIEVQNSTATWSSTRAYRLLTGTLSLLKRVSDDLKPISTYKETTHVPEIMSPPIAASMTIGEWIKQTSSVWDTMTAQVTLLWYDGLLPNLKIPVVAKNEYERLRTQWILQARDVAGELALTESNCSRSRLNEPIDVSIRRRDNRRVSEKLRSAPRFSQWDSTVPLGDGKLFTDYYSRPVLFHERYQGTSSPPPPLPPSSRRRNTSSLSSAVEFDPRYPPHLVVLQHGYQGSRYDFRGFEMALALLNRPNIRVMVAKSNEQLETTEADLALQGANLAGEVAEFMKGKEFHRISFFCYSAGCVIARAALAHERMRPFHHLLHTFVSVAGPHMGSAGSGSGLVSVGQWAMMKWRKSVCLAQLSLSDDDLYLTKLARQTSFGLFRNVCLISSDDDMYVPSFSARMELPLGADSTLASMHRNLVEDLSQIPGWLSKIEMNFSFSSKRPVKERFEALLGRTAHIVLLDSVALNFSLLICFGDQWFFQEE